jgi:hypothetical protein
MPYTAIKKNTQNPGWITESRNSHDTTDSEKELEDVSGLKTGR